MLNTGLVEYNSDHGQEAPEQVQPVDSTLVVESRVQEEMEREARKDGGLPQTQYEHWVDDLRRQPAWRNLADRCADYYDDNQLTADQRQEMINNGMHPIIANIIKPVVNTVLGMEAKNRQDWRVAADSEQFTEVAEVLSAELSEAEREAEADRSCSDAYAAQIKSGLGWVEVARNHDPFGYKYRTEYIHRSEIWWDWRAKRPDLSDARYLMRRRWQDVDVLLAFFPQHKELIENVSGTANTWDRWDLTSELVSEVLVSSQQAEQRTTLDEMEWRDTDRNMLQISELWYRTWHTGPVMTLNGRVVPVDMENEAHMAAIGTGRVQVQVKTYTKMRLAYWIGPHRLIDVEVPKRRHFPYIPFWGFREDRTGIPYGLIRSMLDPQDEYNARRAKLMWLLSAKRVFADSDALDTDFNDFTDLAREVARPDAVVVMNPKRLNKSGIQVDTDHQMAAQQFNVMHDAEDVIQKTAGVYQSMMGQSSQATSGLAINSLVEQGATTLAEINDNYRFARRLVGQALTDLIIADIGTTPTTREVGEGKKTKVLHLNQPMQDGRIHNNVALANVKAALTDVPSTPSYRAQQLTILSELTKSLPPNIQAAIIDFVIEATDISNRREIADRVRDVVGIQDKDNLSPEEQQQLQMQQQKEQAMQDAAIQLEMAKAQADIRDTEASAAKKAADALKAHIDAAMAQRDREAEQQALGMQQHVQSLTKLVEQLVNNQQKATQQAQTDQAAQQQPQPMQPQPMQPQPMQPQPMQRVEPGQPPIQLGAGI